METWYQVVFEIKEWMFFGASILLLLCIILGILMKEDQKSKNLSIEKEFTFPNVNQVKPIIFIYVGLIATILTLLIPIVFPPFESYGIFYLIRQWFLPLWFIFGTLIWVINLVKFLLNLKRNSS